MMYPPKVVPAKKPSMYMQTMSGVMFDLANPHPRDVRIEDIAAHLSRLCRFTGGLADPDAFYPVAEHLSQGVIEAWLEGGRELARFWFSHDFAEAYTGDISRPMKEMLGYERVKVIERAIDGAINERFDLQWTTEIHAAVKVIDDRMLNTERRDLMAPGTKWEKRWLAQPYDYFHVKSTTVREARERFMRYAVALGFTGV